MSVASPTDVSAINHTRSYLLAFEEELSSARSWHGPPAAS